MLFNQSDCVIYALIQSEMQPHSYFPTCRCNALNQTMCHIGLVCAGPKMYGAAELPLLLCRGLLCGGSLRL